MAINSKLLHLGNDVVRLRQKFDKTFLESVASGKNEKERRTMMKSVFEVNKTQALGMLMRNKNSLLILNNILACLYHKFFIEEDLKKDECYFSFRSVYTTHKMTESQKKTALKNLVYYGFIELLQDERKIPHSGCKKIKLLVNPFSAEFGEVLKKENPCRGYPEFS